MLLSSIRSPTTLRGHCCSLESGLHTHSTHRNLQWQADPEWNRKAHVVAPFDSSSNSTGPLAYGGILMGGGLRPLDPAGPEAAEALAFARQRGLFVEEGELAVVEARRLDCDVVGDGAECDQVLWEVSLPGQHQAWYVLFFQSSSSYLSSNQNKSNLTIMDPWHGRLKPRMGGITYLTIKQRRPSSSAPHVTTHRLAVSKDSRGQSAVMQHTSDHEAPPQDSCPSGGPPPPSLSIASFNIWHTMAPASRDRDPQKRWGRYWGRLRHLAAVILESGADVVGLQVSQSVSRSVRQAILHPWLTERKECTPHNAECRSNQSNPPIPLHPTPTTAGGALRRALRPTRRTPLPTRAPALAAPARRGLRPLRLPARHGLPQRRQRRPQEGRGLRAGGGGARDFEPAPHPPVLVPAAAARFQGRR